LSRERVENNQVKISDILPERSHRMAALFTVLYAWFLFFPVLGLNIFIARYEASGLMLTKYTGVFVILLSLALTLQGKVSQISPYVDLIKKAFKVLLPVSLLLVVWSCYGFISGLAELGGRGMPNPIKIGILPMVASYIVGFVLAFRPFQTSSPVS